MKSLVVYYSLTGNTKKIAETIAKNLKADIEEISDSIKKEGLWQKILGGAEDVCQKSILNPLKYNPADYDLTIVGTPVWMSNVSCAIRTWLSQYNQSLKRVAFFATMGGRGYEKAFKNMSLIIHKKPDASIALTYQEIADNHYQQRLNDFIDQINKQE